MISVIIPTLNEAALLPATLEALRVNAARHEVIVVDAGSGDATCEIAAAAGATVLASPRRQRAAQMNFGARQSRGDALMFLHADTRLRPDSLAAVERALTWPGVVGGGFARRFDHPSRVVRWSCALAGWRCRLTGWFFGDQAMFARREAFTALGGFQEWDVFEDVDFARRLRLRGRTVLLGPPIVSSGRRFARGPAWRRVLGDAWLTWRYACGADPQAVAAELSRLRG